MNLINITLTSFGPPTAVWGYLDPGTGSMALQMLLAGMFSALFCMKSLVRRIRDRMDLRDHKA